MVGVQVLSATVRILCLVCEFGYVCGFAWHVNPILVMHVIHVCKNRACFNWNMCMQFMKSTSPVGQCFSNTSAVYVHCRCAVVERDGSDLMFV